MALVHFNYFGSTRFHSNNISQSQPIFEVAELDDKRAEKKNIRPLYLTTKHNLCSKEGVEQQEKWLKFSKES